ncbi:MAG: 5-formyltetrahydrofolate cyclo-ligase [bacterium]|nr:5-formyltetrahydrofolate cyclo-ligase [bacterium]
MTMSFAPKYELRRAMKAKRASLSSEERRQAAKAVVAHIIGMGRRYHAPVALYHPVGNEFDTGPLVQHLRSQSHQLALPVVIENGASLAFRPWNKDDQLEVGAYDILVPPDKGLSVVPELLIIPLLAFDDTGARLGYGGGFYDRTLASLRAEHSICAIGLAYDFQHVDDLAVEPHDQPLDIVLTPSGICKF